MINFSGHDLTFIGTAIANEIAKGKTADETALLGALISMIGDAVSVISSGKTIEESHKNNLDNGKIKK